MCNPHQWVIVCVGVTSSEGNLQGEIFSHRVRRLVDNQRRGHSGSGDMHFRPGGNETS